METNLRLKKKIHGLMETNHGLNKKSMD
jgi:hypothetical protein